MGKQKVGVAELLGRCLAGDREDAWDMLVEYLQPVVAAVVVRTASRHSPVTPELVQDLTQDAFLKFCKDGFAVLHRVHGLTEEAALAYIKVSVANLVHDYFRSETSGTRCPPSGFANSETIDEVRDTLPAERVERQILISEIDQILRNRLPEKSAARDRRIFWLRHRHGMTAKAIAAIPAIGLSEEGVESLLRRLELLVKEDFASGKEFLRQRRTHKGEPQWNRMPAAI